jgi:hypothetical protein
MRRAGSFSTHEKVQWEVCPRKPKRTTKRIRANQSKSTKSCEACLTRSPAVVGVEAGAAFLASAEPAGATLGSSVPHFHAKLGADRVLGVTGRTMDHGKGHLERI